MQYKLHIISDYHIYNTKRRIAELEPITEEIFEQKKASKYILSYPDINIAMTSV